MENKLDKLFRDKLSAHKEIPSMDAWIRINEQLTSKKKKVWSKRLSIAASIILLVGLGYIGIRSLDFVTSHNTEMSSKSIKPSTIAAPELTDNQTNNPEKNDNRTSVEVDKNQTSQVVADMKTIQKKAEKPSELKTEAIAQNSKVPGVAVPDMENKIAKVDNKKSDLVVSNEEVIQSIDPYEEVLAENNQVSAQEEKSVEVAEAKTFPQVKIIYKAGKQSELVESGRKNILDKGITKITEFSDEHLLTAERKTKLRNTTEDVLALNFGKLINKSNREIEN